MDRRSTHATLLLAAALAFACGSEPPPAPATTPPPVDLGPLAAADDGLPDPCEALRAARAPELLGGALAPPMRVRGLCLLQVDRGEERRDQTSAALELSQRDRAGPNDLEAYLEEFGQGLTLEGSGPEDVRELEGVGDFAIWFPHDDGSLTLTGFWQDGRFLSIEIHGVDQSVALPWAKDLATQLARQLAVSTHGRDAST